MALAVAHASAAPVIQTDEERNERRVTNMGASRGLGKEEGLARNHTLGEWRSLPLDLLRPCPEVFQRVVVAAGGVEEVDEDGAVVEKDPLAVLIAFGPQGGMAQLLLQHVVDGVAHGPQLPLAGAGGDDKVVKDDGLVPQIEDGDV